MRRSGFGPAGAAAVLLVPLSLTAPDAHAQGLTGAAAQGLTVIKVAAYTTPQAEGVWIDHASNRYVAMALTGEIQKISPGGVQSTIATLPLAAPPGTVCFGFPAIIGNAYGDDPGELVRRCALL